MFYFAGHGNQVGGSNYLIPIGAQINGESEVKYEAVDAGLVLAQMEEARNRLNILILDACRNNPFARSFRSPSRGLASIDAPVGTLIAYATSPGRTASDGGGRNGLYTKELLAAMQLPGLKLEDVFKRARSEVRRQSNNQQVPWEASSIEGDFYFLAPSTTTTLASPSSTNANPPAPAPSARMSVAGVPLVALNTFTTVTVDDKGKITNRRENQDCWGYVEDLGNGVKLEMVEIQAGEFLMGGDQYDSEKPVHTVRVSGFLMGRYEVTQEQWAAVARLPKVKSDLNADPSSFKGAKLPVENVSWEDAQEFIARLNRKSGGRYALPSEAQWEYAARAGTKTAFAFGSTVPPEIVNYDGNYPFGGAAKGEYRQKTVPVGSLGVANGWGLFDMHGNVWEWCEDDWHGSYDKAPIDGRAWIDSPSRGSLRVDRGGSLSSRAVSCRSAFRYHDSPGIRYGDLGFRLLRTLR